MTPTGPQSMRMDDPTEADRMAIVVANHVKDPCVILYPRTVRCDKPITMNLESAHQLRDDLNQAIAWLETDNE